MVRASSDVRLHLVDKWGKEEQRRRHANGVPFYRSAEEACGAEGYKEQLTCVQPRLLYRLILTLAHRLRLYCIHMAESSAPKGPKASSIRLESSRTGSSSGRITPMPTDHPATGSTSKKVGHKLASWIQKPFSTKKRQVDEPTPTGLEIVPNQNLEAASTTAQGTLLVQTESILFEEDTVDAARMIERYNLAIRAITILQQGVELTAPLVPTPVGKFLEKITKVLEVLKVGFLS